MNEDRLKFLQSYFNENENVKIEIPPQVSETTKGRVTYYFEGERCGYKFTRGVALVERKDLHLFRNNFPKGYFIIHDGQQTNGGNE